MKPLVSVIIAVYNGEKYIKSAIESVLQQTYLPIELLVVNDGSVDDTEVIVKKFGNILQYHSQSNRGQPSAVNCGVRAAKGSYISFLDADDLYMPDKTALQVTYLEEQTHMDFVFGYVEQFLSPELSLEEKNKWVCPSGISPGYLAVAGLFRKGCFDRTGLFNEEQKIGVFIEWYMRAEEKGLKNGLILNQVTRRRIHEGNMGIYSRDSRLEYVKIVKTALKRRGL